MSHRNVCWRVGFSVVLAVLLVTFFFLVCVCVSQYMVCFFRVLSLDLFLLGSILSKLILLQGWQGRIAKIEAKVQPLLFLKLHVCQR